jgi:hypothetical protein
MKSPSCAAPTHDHAWAGRTGPCSPLSSGGCPERCGPIAWSPRRRSCAGIAASFADDGPTLTGPVVHRSTTFWSRWWCGWRGRTRAGALADPGRAAHTRPPHRCLDDPADPEASPHPARLGLHRSDGGAVRRRDGRPHSRVLFGAVVTAEGGPVEIGAHCVVMRTPSSAVCRSTPPNSATTSSSARMRH